jgi:hypothetical protein
MSSPILWLRPMMLLTLAALLAGCAAATAPQPGPHAPQRWVPGGAAADLLAAVPPLPAVLPAAPPAPADPALLERWREPASRWRELELRAIAAEQLDPPRASRALALLDAAIEEGLAAAALARAGGMQVSDHAVIAEAASRAIAHSHPLLSLVAAQELEPATWAGVWRGEASAAGVANGRHLGAAVAAAVLARAAAEHSAQDYDGLQAPAHSVDSAYRQPSAMVQ